MRKIKNTLKDKSGQAAIFILMMFSLLFMFFGMAINIGMLVHNKINLQNAADMAALSAAAEQARILNMIGWKNYELRKNYKDFMYSYWIEYNDRHIDFPDPRPQFAARGNRVLSSQSPGRWTIPRTLGQVAVPSYCAGDTFAGTVAACENSSLPGTIVRTPDSIVSAISSVDPVSGAVLDTMNRLAAQKQAESNTSWDRNSAINTVAAVKDATTYRSRSEDLYETYLNTNRDSTLPGMLNNSRNISGRPVAWTNFENRELKPWPNGNQVMITYANPLNEVPDDFHTLAYKTALNNLNLSNRNGFQFTTLEPENGYVRLNYIRPRITIFWTKFQNIAGSIIPDRLQPITFPIYTGVTKDPTVKTFYALSLQSKPDLPFLPGLSPWTLTAVAAARPFGSRIGPENDNEDNYRDCSIPMQNMQNLQGGCVPTFQVDETTTINDVQVLHDLKQEGEAFEPASHPQLRLPILTPNAYESMNYIFQDFSTSSQNPHWTDQLPSSGGAFTQAHGAANLHTSWNRRAGYSMKLIPLSEILGSLRQDFQDSIAPIKH